MTDLTNYTQSQSYQDYLTVGNSGSTVGTGLPATNPLPVQDGLGNSSPLQLSKTTIVLGGIIQINGTTNFNGGFFGKIISVNAANYTVQLTDYIIGVNFAGAVTITLPHATNAMRGQFFIVGDESGNGLLHNITVNTAGGNINGSASKVINTDFGFFNIYCNGANYFIYGES